MAIRTRAAPVAPALLAIFALGLPGCGGGDAASEGGDLQDFANAAEQLQQQISGGEAVEPLDFRELKELLPERLGDMDRVSHEGQRTGAAGLDISMATARYQSPDGSRSIDVTVTDTGGLGGFAAMGMATWLAMDFDRETDDGYERTTTYEGHPAYEKFEARDGDHGHGELAMVVGKRIILQLEGRNVRMEHITEAAADLELDRLEDMSQD